MADPLGKRWNDLIDRWVRVESRRLDDSTMVRRKLLHTSLVVAAWPILRLERSLLATVLALMCANVALTQRRVPYASLALLTLVSFAGRLAIAGAWVVFTLGDGPSALIGRSVAGPRLPWNSRKSWAGTGTFLVSATSALFVLLRWQQRGIGLGRALLVALTVGGSGALMESLDMPIDDNYSVIAVAGALLHLLIAPARADKGTAREGPS